MARRLTNGMRGHSGCINSIAEVGTDGTVVTASSDKTVRVWSLSEESCLRKFAKYESEVEDVVAVDEDSVMTASGLTVRIFRISDGRILEESAPFQNTVWPCALLGSKTLIAVGDVKGNLFLIERNKNGMEVKRQVHQAHKESIHRIYVFGNKFATCSWDKTAKLWDSNSFECLGTFRGHTRIIIGIAFNESFLVTASCDHTIRAYNIETAKLVKRITTHKNIVNMVHLVEGMNIVVSAGQDKVIALHSLPSGKSLGKYNVGICMNWGIFLKSGLLAMACNDPHNLNVFELDLIRNAITKDVEDAEDEHKQAARHQFKAFTIGRGKSILGIQDVTTAMNMMLTILGIPRDLSTLEIEREVFKVSEDGEVSEDSFVKVFEEIIVGIRASEGSDYWTAV